MKITLESLKALETIERCGSFALAAKELHRVPSALTYTIQTLESHFEEAIFDRSGHKASLTPFGKRLLEEGKKLLNAASLLEKNISLYQSGWEDTITISYDQVIPFKHFLFLIEDFYRECPNVELKWTGEVLGGCWDALINDRAMLSIGVNGEPPSRSNIAMIELGQIEFVFLVASHHPLAKKKEPLSNEQLSHYRSIAVSDTAKGFIARTSGILPDQNILTVSHFQEKIEAMLAGVGIGYLPLLMAQSFIDSGQLVQKQVAKLKTTATFSTAWRPSRVGKGMQWFITKLSDKAVCKKILRNANL
jgi:DNA-binding transcriptional LysR family regulator